ncbi:hypothetical protein [Curtobacterium sp. TXMA1]|uniref:hypothetical protein n=1 Tax=Curtobacterium sp. TXMA1 TaxID=2876939 RepID=UPI001CCB5EEE|nr:hypothetical protein [Curtobacterium sp. TXMA1]UBQ03641.1 hypothetical protein LCG91_05630 [Curtobacterium sp. TXMA1]
MLWGRRRTRSTALTATTLTAVLLLTGCSAHVNAGSAGAEKAERELSVLDGVQSVRGSGTNNLPFAGEVSVRVTADDDLSDADLRRVTHEVGRWIHDESGPGTTYSGSMEADGFRFSLRARASENDRLLAVVDRLRGDDRWLGGDVDAPSASGTGGGRIALTARDADDLVSAWDAVRGAASSIPGWDTASTTASWSADQPDDLPSYQTPDLRIANDVAGTDDTVGDPTPEIAAYERVRAAHEVTRASVTPGRLLMHLADLDDVRDATAIAQQAAPDAQVIVDGGIVTKDEPRGDDDLPDADDYAEADRLAAVAVRPGVTAVSLTPTRVDVTVADPDAVLATATALAAAAPADPVTSIRVGPKADTTNGADGADRDAADDTNRLSVNGSPAMLSASIQIGTALRAFLPASSEQFSTNQSVAATLSDAGQVPAFVAAVRPVLPEGSGLHVRLADRGTGGTTDLTLHDGQLTAEPLRDGEERGADRTDLERALLDAWNS